MRYRQWQLVAEIRFQESLQAAIPGMFLENTGASQLQQSVPAREVVQPYKMLFGSFSVHRTEIYPASMFEPVQQQWRVPEARLKVGAWPENESDD